MTTTESRPTAPAPERRSGELTSRELVRWAWRQLTSMRIALILLLLLALAAVPGSLVPQERVDSLKATQWKDQHKTLTPIYEKLDVFNVYGSPWFAAIYILLMVSLVGCILPRTFHYLRGIRAQPPVAPRNLTRLPSHASYSTTESAQEVLERARGLLGRKRYRLRRDDPAEGPATTVSAEKGYLREVGNLVFHLAVLVVLVGFAIGSLIGYKGGVILVTGSQFSNTPTQYDDFVPGSLFRASQLDPFHFTVDKFDVDWLPSGMARGFQAHLRYGTPGSAEKDYDLRVNHPLTVGNTDLFLIGHGYAPVVTVRDGQGNVVWGPAPQIFLPQGPDLFSFGVVKVPDTKLADGAPAQLGLEGFFYPTFANVNGDPVNLNGQALNPLLSLNVWTGDLGLDSGAAQSVYVLDKSKATALPHKTGMQTLRIDLAPGDTVQLPNGLGSVTFDRVESWQRIQISQTPGKGIALLGVLLALFGVMGSLFIRSRRVWLRVTEAPGGTLVEIAALDRSGGADTDAVLSKLVAGLQSDRPPNREEQS